MCFYPQHEIIIVDGHYTSRTPWTLQLALIAHELETSISMMLFFTQIPRIKEPSSTNTNKSHKTFGYNYKKNVISTVGGNQNETDLNCYA